jgi:hypothetical protein
MRMDEARAVIASTVAAAITETFTRAHDAHSGYRLPAPSFRVGTHAVGHDPTTVPPVPPVQIRLDRDSASPGVAFTWKVESGEPPYLILRVPPHWLRDVVRPGHVVLDGHPVLAILDRDASGRPAQVLAVAVGGGYDTMMHGWRAAGTALCRAVTWDSEETARLAE